MNRISSQVDDLIEETRMRELSDDQVQWRIRKFTQICEREIERGVHNPGKRKMLLERLGIMKCLYDHSSVTHSARGAAQSEEEEALRVKRLQNIVRRRRMALEMIERVDESVADRIIAGLEREYANSGSSQSARNVAAREGDSYSLSFELNSHHWYFFYFNVFLLAFLILTLLMVLE